jgi:DNA-binding XRE family transcriptional regulator
MNTCTKCRGDVHVRLVDRYEVKKELIGGMRVEVVDAVSELVCTKCGAVLRTDIPNLPSLLAAIAIARSKSEMKLNGSEIRFLRKTLGLPAKELSDALDVAEETVSRWENGHLVIGNSTERLLRWKVCSELADKAPEIKWNDDDILFGLDIVSVMPAAFPEPMVFYLHKASRASRHDAYWLQKKAA